MRLRVFSFVFALLLSSCLIAFSGVSIDAYALTGGDYLSTNDARALFGDTLSIRFYQNSGGSSGYVDTTAEYVGSASVDTVYSDTSFDSVYSGAPFLVYRASTPAISSNPNFITVRANPSYSVVDTDVLHTFIGCSFYSDQYRISSSFTSPSWNWSNGHYENSATDSNGHKSYFRSNISSSSWPFSFVPVDISTNSNFSAYCQDANFYGNLDAGYGVTYIAVGVPYISSSSSVHQGTDINGSGGSGGSGNVNVTVDVDVDMSETNEELQTQTGIFRSIVSWLGDFFSDLSDTVVSWFVPSENFFENWVDEIQDTIIEHFMPHMPLHGQLENIASDLALALGQGGVSSVQFPALSVPGTEFSLPAYSVPLVPSGFESYVEYVKVMIDCLCTVWVFNMVLNRVHALIVGETSVEVIDHAD